MESSFKEREHLAQNRKDKLFNVFGSGLSSAETNPVPKYLSHFTIAHFENGRYKTSFKGADFKDELALAPGHYMLVTGNRINDGKILSTLSFFELKENEHKTIDIKLRK